MGRRAVVEPTPGPEVTTDDADGEVSAEIRTQPTSAQRLISQASATEVSPDPFGREAKHFTEIRTLHRDVSNSIICLSYF